MARTLSDFLATSKRATNDDVAAAQATFAPAYKLARQLIELREKHGMTQVDLSVASGVPQAQISRIERGAVHPTTTTLTKLTAALGAEIRLVEIA